MTHNKNLKAPHPPLNSIELLSNTIAHRKSIRTYQGDAVEKIDVLATPLPEAPFGNSFDYIQETKDNLGMTPTYGMMSGQYGCLFAPFIVSQEALVDYGYITESIVIDATANGIGTCWVAGTVNKKALVKKWKIMETQSIPAVIIYGIPGTAKGLRQLFSSKISQSTVRKSMSEILLSNDFTGYTPVANDPYLPAFEAVRIAPSAINKQPWRLVLDGPHIHFYKFGKKVSDAHTIDVAKIDLGIALYHFDAIRKVAGLAGAFNIVDSAPTKEGFEYIISYKKSE